MTKGSKLLLYLFLGGPALVVLLFLLMIGPVGWFVAGFFVLGGMVLRSFTEDTEQAPRKENCPACGVPNPPDSETCRYCDEVL